MPANNYYMIASTPADDSAEHQGAHVSEGSRPHA
jgi:hypothetical protein